MQKLGSSFAGSMKKSSLTRKSSAAFGSVRAPKPRSCRVWAQVQAPINDTAPSTTSLKHVSEAIDGIRATLGEYRSLQGALRPWIQQHLARTGRRPTCQDAEQSGLAWVQEYFRRYTTARQKLFTEIPTLRDTLSSPAPPRTLTGPDSTPTNANRSATGTPRLTAAKLGRAINYQQKSGRSSSHSDDPAHATPPTATPRVPQSLSTEIALLEAQLEVLIDISEPSDAPSASLATPSTCPPAARDTTPYIPFSSTSLATPPSTPTPSTPPTPQLSSYPFLPSQNPSTLTPPPEAAIPNPPALPSSNAESRIKGAFFAALKYRKKQADPSDGPSPSTPAALRAPTPPPGTPPTPATPAVIYGQFKAPPPRRARWLSDDADDLAGNAAAVAVLSPEFTSEQAHHLPPEQPQAPPSTLIRPQPSSPQAADSPASPPGMATPVRLDIPPQSQTTGQAGSPLEGTPMAVPAV